jgi:WD40-like Beta Propeller Repeat
MSVAAFRRTSSLALALCFLAGCGGSGARVEQGSTASTTSIGQAVVTYFGQVKPQLTASSGNVTVSAVAGALITGVTAYPSASLQSTYLFFGRTVGGQSEIYRVPYTGGTEQLLTHSVEQVNEPAPASNGSVFYSGYFGEEPGIMLYDGSHVASFSPGGPGYFLNPSVSPNAAKVAFDTTSYHQLWVCSASGGSAVQVTGAVDSSYGTSWAPTNLSVAYVQQNTGAYENIDTIPIAGGTPTDVSPPGLQSSGNFYSPSWSSDGISIAASYTPTSGSASEVLVFTTNTFFGYARLTPTGNSDTYPSFSPDGSKVAFYRSNAGGAIPGIYVCDYDGSNSQLLVEDQTSDGAINSLTWSPFPASEKLIGSGGRFYGANASGFLYSQVGSQFGSCVAFATTTPSTATITAPSGVSGSQPLSFLLTGDNITSLGYLNGYFSTGPVFEFSGTNPNVVVNIDGSTGQVDTFAVAAAKPALTASAGKLTYAGRFNAVYDATGKNVAPNGASQLVVDSKTGHLLSFK